MEIEKLKTLIYEFQRLTGKKLEELTVWEFYKWLKEYEINIKT